MSVLEHDKLLRKLQSLNEADLVKRIVLPLLRTYDFHSIEPRHGPHEKGVDILCLRQDELGSSTSWQFR